MPRDTDRNNEETLKAGALICPTCCVAYMEVEYDFEFEGIILHNVKTLKCPVCQEELFTPEQQEVIQKQLRNLSPP